MAIWGTVTAVFCERGGKQEVAHPLCQIGFELIRLTFQAAHTAGVGDSGANSRFRREIRSASRTAKCQARSSTVQAPGRFKASGPSKARAMSIAAQQDRFPGTCVWPAALIVWEPGSTSSSHSHHAVQLILALSGSLRVRSRRSIAWQHTAAAVVAPDAPHEVDARGVSVLMVFMDPESELAASLRRWGPSNIAAVPDGVVKRWRHTLGDPHTLDAQRVEAWVRSELLNEGRSRRIHPNVSRVLGYLREHLPDRRHASLAQLAAVANLSPSRLMHVFTESLGIPLRPYVLWLRVQRAARALATGQTATEAAHLAGFADAAHLTRTFRRTLGTTPRELMARISATREVHVSAHETAARSFKTG